MIAKVRTSAVIPASLETVWAITRDFNGLPNWHPAVVESTIENGGGGAEVGSIRRFRRTDGLLLREQLVVLDDLEPTQTYRLIDPPFPVSNHVATLRFRRITGSNETFAEWLAWYDNAPMDEAMLRESFQEVFRTGFDALKGRFSCEERPYRPRRSEPGE